MSRNLVAIVSSALFVLLAAALVLVPVPFVTWRPGQTVDVLGSNADGPLIEISGISTSEGGGSLLLTTVSTTRVDSSLSLPEALIAYIASDSDAMPRDVVYPPGKSSEDVQSEAVAMMDTSRNNATVAALRAAGQAVTEMPMVSGVSLSGPAADLLRPGDLIETVNGTPVANREEVGTAIRSARVGDAVVFQVIRDGVSQVVTVTTVAGSSGGSMIGINLSDGYRYAPTVTYHIDPDIVGPSAGLVFALAVYDRITDGLISQDAVIAGTGTIDASGKVEAIGAVREKIKGAEKAGATVFLLPQDNCADVGDLSTGVRLIPVSTLRDAIAVLQLMNEAESTPEVPACG